MSGRSDRVTFRGRGGQRLAARWDRPAGQPWAQALFAHCFSCNKDYKALHWISRQLSEAGVAVLRLDFTGLGESSGEFADTNFTTNVDDLLAAADYLRGEGAPPSMLLGHSLGGAAALIAAGQIREVSLLVTISAPSSTTSLRETLLAERPELASEGEAEVPILGRPFRLKRQLLDDLATHQIDEAAREWRHPWLIVHALQDDVVAFEHAERLFGWAGGAKTLVALPEADHLLADQRRDAQFIADLAVLWLRRVQAAGE